MMGRNECTKEGIAISHSSKQRMLNGMGDPRHQRINVIVVMVYLFLLAESDGIALDLSIGVRDLVIPGKWKKGARLIETFGLISRPESFIRLFYLIL